jgi:hypothetical protein
MTQQQEYRKVFCPCGWRGTEDRVLKALNPFDDLDIIVGCPRCKHVNTILTACEVEGCWLPVECGTPKSNEYRITCSKHRPTQE